MGDLVKLYGVMRWSDRFTVVVRSLGAPSFAVTKGGAVLNTRAIKSRSLRTSYSPPFLARKDGAPDVF